MGTFVKGDVVVADFPYDDLSTTKRRPTLVLAALDGNRYLLSQITSQKVTDRYAVQLMDTDFEGGSIQRESVIRTNVVFTANDSLIKYKAGRIKQTKVLEVVSKLIEILTQDGEPTSK